ncbi:hypothetical protein [Xylella taiwanensis]|nr:hypothetical protein [Xylella taiwanensis]MCD8464363.1 hypothetical protein [Xylella taiwanensis]MCD8469582.1 hypothetical protein [Xylella taiwanensis]QKD99303.1 hypothetical protein PLS229_11115 [Xylella taiwanensis]UFN14517.1 hypothetical protein LPH61_04770 [Xylella taiwanensis]
MTAHHFQSGKILKKIMKLGEKSSPFDFLQEFGAPENSTDIFSPAGMLWS